MSWRRGALTVRGAERTELRALYALLGATESAWTPFSALYLRSRGFDPGEIGGTLAAMALAAPGPRAAR